MGLCLNACMHACTSLRCMRTRECLARRSVHGCAEDLWEVLPQCDTEDRWRDSMLMDDPFMELPIMCTRLGEYIT